LLICYVVVVDFDLLICYVCWLVVVTFTFVTVTVVYVVTLFGWLRCWLIATLPVVTLLRLLVTLLVDFARCCCC